MTTSSGASTRTRSSPGSAPNASRRLIQPLSNVANIIQCDPTNRSSYNSAQFKLLKRYAAGLQFLLSYTFGKSLDYAGSAASGGGAVGNAQSITLFDQSRGPSGYDVKHRFVLSYVWDLPFGEGHRMASGGIGKALLGDWQFSGIITLSTGRPFTVFLNTGVNNGAPSWPNRIGDGKLEDPDASLWFDIADFVAPNPGNVYGDSGRGVLYAPGSRPSTSRWPAASPSEAAASTCSSARRPSTCSTPRSSGSPNPNIGNPSAGRITSTVGDNRQMQFALKLDW